MNIWELFVSVWICLEFREIIERYMKPTMDLPNVCGLVIQNLIYYLAHLWTLNIVVGTIV